MCVAVSYKTPRNYSLRMTVWQSQLTGMKHTSEGDFDKFADAFGAVKRFWDAHPNEQIDVHLSIRTGPERDTK